jgi:hypothetical protein
MERRVMVSAIDTKPTAVSSQPLGVVKVQLQVTGGANSDENLQSGSVGV